FGQPAPRHTLWEVSGERSTVYLLGSVHLLKKEHYPLPWAFDNAFSNSQIAVFETDLDEMERPELQQRLLDKARLPPGETLRQRLSPDTYARFKKRLAAAGLPTDLFNHLKPSVAAKALAVTELRRLGFNSDYGVDRYYFYRAKQEGKSIQVLETAEFQFELLTGFSDAEGELFVRTTLMDIEQTRTSFNELLNAWSTGDTERLRQLLSHSRRKAAVIHQRTVLDRNQKWLPALETLLQGNQNAIVIVGAGHLVGTGSLIELLRQQGYRVQQR
ncbi:MAG TPA: TraB/GumN family protein, partial [Clostridia bacterium]|nr:TraB/GumN family protein [Clostridia bacterium]